jgi:hypothetical protein
MQTTNGNNYYLNLNSPTGQRLTVLNNFTRLNYARAEKQLGKLSVTVPLSYWILISEYCQLEVWRSPIGIASPRLELDTLWFIVYYHPYVDETGQYLLEIQAVDSLLLLAERTVAYFSGTSQTSKNGFAGDMVKAIATENIGAAANDYTGTANTGAFPRGIPANYFTIEPNKNDGASVALSFAWRNCLEAMNDIADASATAGIYLSFDVVYDGFGNLQLRTYAGQRGNDHTLSGPNPIILDQNAGNLGATQVEYDFTNEVNFVYCGGQDTGIDRAIATSSNQSRFTLSPFSRREIFTDARQSDTVAQVQDSADADLRAGKGHIIFTSQIIENPSNRYGIEYNFGDIFPCQFLNRTTNCRLDKIEVNLEGAVETIRVNLTSVA